MRSAFRCCIRLTMSSNPDSSCEAIIRIWASAADDSASRLFSVCSIFLIPFFNANTVRSWSRFRVCEGGSRVSVIAIDAMDVRWEQPSERLFCLLYVDTHRDRTTSNRFLREFRRLSRFVEEGSGSDFRLEKDTLGGRKGGLRGSRLPAISFVRGFRATDRLTLL